jgi:MYXO-CTERM domain-containing protein
MPSPSLWENTEGFVLAPVAVWITTVGLGLFAERVARARLTNALLVPLGYCVAVVLCLGVYTSGVGDTLLLPILGVLVVAGFALARDELPGRLNAGWPLLAGVAAYLLFDLSVIATGHWTFTGYRLEDDVAFELLLARHLQEHGTALGALQPSTAKSFIVSFLSTGYPLGTQSYLGAIGGLLHAELASIWQGFLSSLAAVGAIAAATLSGRTMDRRVAALVGLLAMAAALTYQYAMQGSIKEFGTAVAVLSALALVRFAILELRGVAPAVIVAISLAAILATYNAAGVPYVLALAGTALLASVLVHRRLPARDWLRPAAISIPVFLVLAAPALKTLKQFFEVATTGFTGAAASAPPLGQLLRPLPLSEVVGVWLQGDYRVQVAPGLPNDAEVIATVAMLALFALGMLFALRRREPAPLMGAVTMGLVLLIVYPKAIPYAQAKLLAIASPIFVLGAAQGVAAMRARRLLPVSLLVGGGLAAAVLMSDALAYHHDPVAPTPRLIAMRDVGPVLVSEFDEFAKYFAFPARLWVGVEYPTPENLALINPGGLYAQSFDLDQEQLPFVESFPYILVRRSPSESRPPSNFRRVYSSYFYEVWQRTSSPQVLAHLPLQQQYSAYAPVDCPQLQAIVRHAPAGSSLVLAQSPLAVGYDVLHATVRSSGWIEDPEPYTPDAVTPLTPGAAGEVVRVPRTGTYEVWVQGSFPRAIRVTIGGRTVGSVDGWNTPDEWLQAATVDVGAGAHALDIFRPGGGLAPGDGGTGSDGGKGEIGRVELLADEPERLRTVPLSAWHRLCGAQADWVELVRP